MPLDPVPASTPAPAAATTAPAAPSTRVIPTAAPAGGTAVKPRPLVAATKEQPAVHDVTPAQAVIHRIEFTKEQAVALFAAIDPQAPEGKTAGKVIAQVGPAGELFLTITYAE
jgi:hypothetical protein